MNTTVTMRSGRGLMRCGVYIGKTEGNQESRSPFRGSNTGSADYEAGLMPT